MKSPSFYNVVLFDRQGYELTRAEALEGMKRAKEHAKHLLSDEYAQGCESSHATWGTAKVAIFKEDYPIGANSVCEWDKEHPQHGEWVRAEEKKEQDREAAALAQQEREELDNLRAKQRDAHARRESMSEADYDRLAELEAADIKLSRERADEHTESEKEEFLNKS